MMRKKYPILKIINSTLIDLPAPSNINHFWNFGSLLGICLIMQTLSGIFLAMHYSSSILTAFDCINHIMRNVESGWFVRLLHANGASLFFIAIYLHMSRNLYYQTFQSQMAWISGVLLFLLSMMTAFLGYVLPWGQMSYWGATVITNLLSAMPYIGKTLVEWVWGGYSVDNATLSRFFSLHYLLPFILIMVMMIHLVFIHEKTSSNPMGLDSMPDKIPFHPYFSLKDTVSLCFILFMFTCLNLQNPFLLMDPDNFTPANPLVTPTHIQPEWYFLFAYAILRAIPNKLGGVMALLMSILIFLTLLINPSSMQNRNTSVKTFFFWMFSVIFFFLTLLGTKPVEDPFTTMSYYFTFFYFLWFLV